ncbi:MAG: adenylate/guanylate cyclase domain-containing protein [Bryobacterales bacterium]|nr:adenylate/guanylate cyclase domain-containing protein [Bryobacterales bacterium]
MSEQPGAYLDITDGTNSGRLALSPGAVCRIGRSDGNTIVVADTLASRNHALIQSSPDGIFYLTDLGSTNGTTVNGMRISTPVMLRHRDCIQIGSLRFTFQQVGAAEPETVRATQGPNGLGQMRTMSALVVDVRDLTGLERRLGPDRLGEVTGMLFRDTNQALQIYGAWSQKYTGNAVIAVWLHSLGANVKEFLPALEALRAMRDIAGMVTSRFQLGEPIRMGAGVSTGVASTNNFADTSTSDYAALGEVVHRAFRLVAASRELGCEVVLGADSYSLLRGHETAKELFLTRQVQLPGHMEESVVYSTSLKALNPLIRALITPEDAAMLNKTRKVR